MKLEYLYPELGNLYGDSGNILYLQACLPEAELIETHVGDEPAFVSHEDVVFVYSGSMTERGQGIALEALRTYEKALRERLEGGMHGLFTGNSLELLGTSITEGDTRLDGLGLVPLTARRNLEKRYNGLFLGNAEDIEIVGFHSRFSHASPGEGLTGFAAVERGIGLEEGCKYEGYRFHNLIGTYLLGPVLVLNPLLTQRIMQSIGISGEPARFQEALAAYEARLREFRDKKRKLD